MGPEAGAGELPRATAGSGSSGRTSGQARHQARPSSAKSQNTDGQPNALISGPQMSSPIAEPRSSEPKTVVTARARSPLRRSPHGCRRAALGLRPERARRLLAGRVAARPAGQSARPRGAPSLERGACGGSRTGRQRAYRPQATASSRSTPPPLPARAPSVCPDAPPLCAALARCCAGAARSARARLGACAGAHSGTWRAMTLVAEDGARPSPSPTWRATSQVRALHSY